MLWIPTVYSEGVDRRLIPKGKNALKTKHLNQYTILV